VVYDVLDELVLVEATVPETTEEDVGFVVDEELDDDVTVPLFVLGELVGLELEVEADEIEDVLLDELVVATEEELLDELMLLVVELVDETEDVLLDELVLLVVEVLLLVVELVLLLVDELEVLETVAEELLLVVELLDELVLEVLVVELVDEVEVVDEVELLLVVELVEVLLVVEELLLVVEVVEVLLVVQTPGEAGTAPHWYTSNLFPEPQNSFGAPPQGILQSDNGAETLPHCNWFPQ
jgi:hypothetical protein